MKNAIHYFYNLNPSSIHQRGKLYYFQAEGQPYVLLPCENEIESQSIYEFSNRLLASGVPVHQIIVNTSRQILTKIHQELYVLMKISVSKETINLEKIIQLNTLRIANLPNNLRRDDWFTLWTKKIDYVEYQISQIGKKYPLIIDSINYYVGLAENAITLIQMTNKENMYLTLNHRRICCGDNSYRFYNPFNIIMDLRMRDACDYFKSCFFKNQQVEIMIQQYLYYQQFTKDELQCFFARMLFPTYYFDMYEQIIAGNIEEKEIRSITEKADKYETLMRNIYDYIGVLPEIEWLKKKTPM